jgi:hypothetical protein
VQFCSDSSPLLALQSPRRRVISMTMTAQEYRANARQCLSWAESGSARSADSAARSYRWLSTLRNDLQYRHYHDVWFPSNIENGIESLLSWKADPMSLDLDAGRFGVFSLLPAVVDAVKVPVVATGELRTGAGSRRRCCGVLLPRKSAPHFCVAPKLRFPSLGRWAARHGFVSPTMASRR